MSTSTRPAPETGDILVPAHAERTERGSAIVLDPSETRTRIAAALEGKTGAANLKAGEGKRFVIEVAGEAAPRVIRASSLRVRLHMGSVLLLKAEEEKGPETDSEIALAKTDPQMPVARDIAPEAMFIPDEEEPAAGREDEAQDPDVSAPRPRANLSIHDLREEDRNSLLEEQHLRSELQFAAQQPKTQWAAAIIAWILGEAKVFDPKEDVMRQFGKLNALPGVPLAKKMLTKMLLDPMESPQKRRVALQFCDGVAKGGGPSAEWAARVAKAAREGVAPAESAEQLGSVVSGKMPTAQRALELLKGKSAAEQRSGLGMLEALVGQQRFAHAVAGNGGEEKALREIEAEIAAAQKDEGKKARRAASADAPFSKGSDERSVNSRRLAVLLQDRDRKTDLLGGIRDVQRRAADLAKKEAEPAKKPKQE